MRIVHHVHRHPLLAKIVASPFSFADLRHFSRLHMANVSTAKSVTRCVSVKGGAPSRHARVKRPLSAANRKTSAHFETYRF